MLKFSLSFFASPTVLRIFFIGSFDPSSLPRCFLLGGTAIARESEDWEVRGRGWVCDSCATMLTSSSRRDGMV